MIHQILGCSQLAALRPGHDARPALDEAAALGFNLVRVFAGRLSWCGQEPHHALERLPDFLRDSHDRGMNAEVVALTDTAMEVPDPGRPGETKRVRAFDPRSHAAAVAERVTPFDILEWGNEPWDVEQWELTPAFLASLPRPAGVKVTLGASQSDEATDYAGADFVAAHLDRGRDKWNQVRRVRELLAISEQTGKPVLNQEPIGAAEASIPGKRESDPAFYYTLGALNRLFLGGNGVFHSESGLWARPLGPTERACAEAYLAGVRVWPGAHRLQYRNSNVNGGWDESPVQSHNLNTCVRAYSGIDGVGGFTVALGISGDPGLVWGGGWFPSERIGRMAGVDIWKVQRG